MAHKEQVDFCTYVKEKYPERFHGCSVLDIGSYDINGNNHYLFSNYKYIGIDVGEGKNVDHIIPGHQYDTEDRFDIVISTECFEHDPHYGDTIRNAIRLLKSGGLFMFTCASTDRPEHGTSLTDVYSNPLGIKVFNDYYKNLIESDIRTEICIEDIFSNFEFKTNAISHDLYFWGIKK